MGLKSNCAPSASSLGLWLKSDQNGIEIFRITVIFYPCEGLKSDQNGIEILFYCVFIVCSFGLKSDQNGIEIVDLGEEVVGDFLVKIRPKWD